MRKRVRQGSTSIYYTYILYAGATPEAGPWKVVVHGNDVNWTYFPETDAFSQEFTDLDEALRNANGEDDSYFAQSTIPARPSLWPWERPAQSHTIIEFGPAVPRMASGDSEVQRDATSETIDLD